MLDTTRSLGAASSSLVSMVSVSRQSRPSQSANSARRVSAGGLPVPSHNRKSLWAANRARALPGNWRVT